MRQSFGSKTHKVAAEYPYLSDTSIKRFDQDEIVWDQTNGLFTVRASQMLGATGNFGTTYDFQTGEPHVRRSDGTSEPITFYLINGDFGEYSQLLTLGTRAQNSGLRWASDSLSFAKDFGTAPTIMAAASLELAYPEPATVGWAAQMTVQPLDAKGLPWGAPFKSYNPLVIDQTIHNTPWFAIRAAAVQTGAVSEIDETIDVVIYPNPVTSLARIASSSAMQKIVITNAIGQTVATHNLSDTSGEVDVSTLPPGAYTIIIETAKGKKILPLRKL
jgi:hypothetical protein